MANIESNTLLDKLNEINSIKNRTRQALIDVGGGDYINEQSLFSEFPAVIKQLFSDTKSANQLCEYILNGGSLDDIISGDKVKFSQFVPYLVKFQQNKSLLVNNLRLKGVECSIEESLESLLGKILNINGGEPSPEPSPGPDPEGLLFSTIVNRGDYSLKFDAIDLGETLEENGTKHYKIRYRMTNTSSSSYDGVIIKVVFLSNGLTDYYNDNNIGSGSSYEADILYDEDNYTFAKNDLVNNNVSVFFDLLEYCTPIDFTLSGDPIGYNNLEISGTRYISSYLGITYVATNTVENPQELPGRVALCFINNEYNNYGLIFNEEIYYGGYNILIYDSNETTELFLCNYDEDLNGSEWSYDTFYCLYLDYNNSFDSQMHRNVYTGNNTNISMYYDIMKINNVGVYVRHTMQTNDETGIPYSHVELSQMYLDINDSEYNLNTSKDIPNRPKFKIRQLFKFDDSNAINSCYMTFDEVVSIDPETSHVRLIKSQILSKDGVKLRYKIIDYGIDSDNYYTIRREISNLTNNEIKHLIIAEEYSISNSSYVDLIRNGTVYPENHWFNYNIYGGNYDGVNLQGYSQASYHEQIEQLNSITSLYLITDKDYIKRSHSLDTSIVGYNGYTEEVGLYYSEGLNFTIINYASYNTSDPQSYGNMYVENGLNILAIDLNNQKHKYITSFNNGSNISLRSKYDRLYEGNYLNYIVFLAQYDDYNYNYGTYDDAYNAYMKYYGKNYNNYIFSDYSGTNTYSYTTLENVSNVYDLNNTQSIAIVDKGNNTIKAIPIHSNSGINTMYASKINISNNSYLVSSIEEAEIVLPDAETYNKIKNKEYSVIYDTLEESSKIAISTSGGDFYNYILNKTTASASEKYYWRCQNLGGIFVRAKYNIDSSFEGLSYVATYHNDSKNNKVYENTLKTYINKGNTREIYKTAYFSNMSDNSFIEFKLFGDVYDNDKATLSNYIDTESNIHNFSYWYFANTNGGVPNAEFIRELEPNKSGLLMVTTTPSTGKTEYYVEIFHKFYTDSTDCIIAYNEGYNTMTITRSSDRSSTLLGSGSSGLSKYNNFKENYTIDFLDNCNHKSWTTNDITAELYKCTNTNTLVLKYSNSDSASFSKIYLKDANGETKMTAYSGNISSSKLYNWTLTNSADMSKYNSIEEAFNDIANIEIAS